MLTRFPKSLSSALLGICLLSLLAGCPSPKQAQKGEQPAQPKPPAPKKAPVPEMTVTVASIDLSHYGKRIEQGDIDRFAGFLRQYKPDIICVEGIARYPGVTTRADVVDGIGASASLRQAFGEMISVSGRQTGNAIFTLYPIRSTENTHYTGLASPNFETAFQATIDCGLRDVVVVSTQIPDRASLDDQATCANLLGTFTTFYVGHPVIIAGNLPKFEVLHTMEQYREARLPRPDQASRFWYSGDGSLSLIKLTAEPTNFGTLAVAQFGIFRQSQP